jgi:hypothetical protein
VPRAAARPLPRSLTCKWPSACNQSREGRVPLVPVCATTRGLPGPWGLGYHRSSCLAVRGTCSHCPSATPDTTARKGHSSIRTSSHSSTALRQ